MGDGSISICVHGEKVRADFYVRPMMLALDLVGGLGLDAVGGGDDQPHPGDVLCHDTLALVVVPTREA